MIYVFGDSWTAKWQEYDPWPSVLESKFGIQTKNFGIAGSSNQQILDEVITHTIVEKSDVKVDHAIVAFTSVDRITACLSTNVELCIAAMYQQPWYKDIQETMFREVGVKKLLRDTDRKLRCMKYLIQSVYNCDVTFIPVFEDCEYWRERNIHHSLVNIMFYMQHGRYLAYDAAVYDPGLLENLNYLGTEWTEKYLPSNYERAYFERTQYITSYNWFDDTWHPNQAGHDAIAEYMVKNLNISRFSS